MIRNITRGRNIAGKHVVLATLFGHMMGLMFKRKITPHVLVFGKPRKVSLHTFFVSAPIDIIFVNNNKVCEIKEALHPFSFYSPTTKAEYIIEVKAGTIRKTMTKVGDHIKLT